MEFSPQLLLRYLVATAVSSGTVVVGHTLSKRNEDRRQTGQSCINCVRQSVYAFAARFSNAGRHAADCRQLAAVTATAPTARCGHGLTTRRTIGGQFTQRPRGQAARPADGGKARLRREQDKRRKRDNLLAISAGAGSDRPGPDPAAHGLFLKPDRRRVRRRAGGTGEPVSVRHGDCCPRRTPTNIPKPDTAAGKTFTGELKLNRGTLGVELDGTKAPQAAAVFKSLADQNFYTGLNCHRLTTAETFGVLQCGSKAGDGSSDPSYTWGPLENTPADNKYPAGTIAVARTGGNAYGNGTQFFIVYKDTVIPADAAGGYTVVGKVTSGLDVVERDCRGRPETGRQRHGRRTCGTSHDRLVLSEVTSRGPGGHGPGISLQAKDF